MGYESNRYQDEAGKPKKNVLDVAGETSSTPVALKRQKLVIKKESSTVSKANKSGTGKMRNHLEDSEIIAMWDTIAASNSEAEEGEDEIDQAFMIGRRKKKIETTPSEIAVLVETAMAELYVAVEEDAELNRQEKPAITKLRNLSLLTDIIPRKHLQEEFLDRGVLDALKAWLEPLPDGSIPNINVRAAVFKCLSDLTIDLKQSVRREQLKKSGIGKAVMFYCKYDQETAANRRVAKELVDKWSRAIFKISTRYEDLTNNEEKRTYRRPPVKKPMSNAAAGGSQDNDFDTRELSQGQKSEPSSPRRRASIPEAVSMDFAVRPESKVDPEAVRARAKQTVQGYHRAKLNKKLQRRKAPDNYRP